MYPIIRKKELNSTVTQMEILAPLVAAKARPGQFIILRVDENGERIPLTVAGTNPSEGTVKIIFQIVGATTEKLNRKAAGDTIQDFVGPLGAPTHMDGMKKVCIVGGGVGCAIAMPIAEAFHALGAEVTSVIGFRSQELVILEEEFRACSDHLILMTDDGSYGREGNVTLPLRELLTAGESFDRIFAIGPLVMMKFVVATARPFGVPVTVSMNPIMIDGTGMCGGCRLTLTRDGKKIAKFACVDGPDFDGYEVDFEEAISRGRMYSEFERHAHARTCHLFEAAEATAQSAEEPKAPTTPAPSAVPASVSMPNMARTKNPMPVQEPSVRAHNFCEVALGYTESAARDEAARCLNCKTMPCVSGCPVNVRIPAFIAKIKEGDFEGAYDVIAETSSLPAICGRVCPQETQCEKNCVRGKAGDPVGIGRLERFVADRHLENASQASTPPAPNGHRVAVIGSGPSGLTCAGDLAKKGYSVTIFEALHTIGGVLVYGIPEFRLPKAIVSREVEKLKNLGVQMETNVVIGKTLTIDELLAMGYEAVFIGSGAGLPNFMGIPGESLKGVYSANEFLTRSNLMKAYEKAPDTPIMKGGNVAVVGGGNVAMDAARTALRLGADHVFVVYRRSMEELPARKEEVEHAMEEGITFHLLTNPVEILGFHDPENPKNPKNGFVTGMKCIQMALGEPDERGRRRPVPVEGSDFVLPVDTVIMAIGTSPNPLIKNTTTGLETGPRGGIIVNEDGLTSKASVYAGGDAVTGAATVISAMGAGKVAARAIDEALAKK